MNVSFTLGHFHLKIIIVIAIKMVSHENSNSVFEVTFTSLRADSNKSGFNGNTF